MLAGWLDWARLQRDLSRAQRAMCRGPDEAVLVDGFDHAEVAGITFTRAGHAQQASKPGGAKTCTVKCMVWARSGQFAVGQARLFIKWLLPWAASSDDVVETADVQLYERKGVKAELCSGELRKSPEHCGMIQQATLFWLKTSFLRTSA